VNNTPPQSNSSSIDAIFAQLNQRDIEEFYTGYQCWNLHQQIAALQTRLGDLHRQIAANTQRMQEVHPTAIALATLARLQSNGVSDIDLLDRMLEQGELWLDRTMQRLEYFEQLDDFISDDYTQWCQLALDGAYDWIDSMLDGSSTSSSPVAASEEEELTEATEELFLQKLSSDEYEDESSMLETTLKRPAITQENITPDSIDDTADSVVEEPALQEYVVPEEPLSVESSSISDSEHPSMQEFVEVSPATKESPSTPLETLQQSEEHTASEVPSPDSKEIETHPLTSIPEAREQHQQNETPKRPNFIRRFIGKIWGS
jgi:hypothetical protein